jgi:hypothetical protein
MTKFDLLLFAVSLALGPVVWFRLFWGAVERLNPLPDFPKPPAPPNPPQEAS